MSEPEVVEADSNFNTVKLFLIGRICICHHEPEQDSGKTPSYTALFLNARHNRELGSRKHRPLMTAPFRRMDNHAAEEAELSFCNIDGHASGMWKIKGYDLGFKGLKRPASEVPDVKLDTIADLNLIYEKVDKDAKWLTSKELLDQPDPRRHGVATRLSLAGFDKIVACSAFDGDGRRLTFLPGNTEMTIEGGVLCIGKFKKGVPGPFLEGPAFNGRSRMKYSFDGEGDLTLTMSNLCTCAGHIVEVPAETGDGDDAFFSHDDGEFRVYYDLLAKPPAKDKRPIPCRPGGVGAGNVAECYDTGRIRIGG